MQEIIFIIILAVFIGGMLWSDRDSRRSDERLYMFIGFQDDDKMTFDSFIVGRRYKMIGKLYEYHGTNLSADAMFDNGFWENIKHFRKVY